MKIQDNSKCSTDTDVDVHASGEFSEVIYPGAGFVNCYRKEYIYSPYGLIAIRNELSTRNGSQVYIEGVGVYPVATDHLGSIVAAYSPNRRTWEFSGYDAWGRRYRYDAVHDCREYPDEEKITGMDLHGVLDAFSRGYTGHEHLDMFGLINMNGRMYDPMLGRMLSPDTYVPNGTFTQDFNRYAYARNNPLSYLDPDGEFVWLAVGIVSAVVLFFTDPGYELQKAILPVAFKVDLKFGSDQRGIGFDFSYGLPTLIPVSYRAHQGKTYYWKYNDLMGNDLSGWETRKGGEWSVLFGMYKYGGTTYNSDWSGEQTTNYHKLRLPGIAFHYENDMPPSGFLANLPGVPNGDGDRYRTASAKIKFGGFFEIGTQMITGDAGPFRNERDHYRVDEYGNEIYIPFGKYNPNSHRTGLLYFKVGPISIGRNSEQIRHVFQNRFAHDFIKGGDTYWFEVLNLKRRWFWQIGGSGLW